MIRDDSGLEPLGQLGPEPWLTAPETRALAAALMVDDGAIRFVGGCVRDALLHRPVRDVDIATRDHPHIVMDKLARAGIRTIPTGLAHGTVTAIVGDKQFEITTLRQDVENYGRHAQVVFCDDWMADAARRDFTINAMSADLDGRVYAPFNGLPDLAAGWVRFVGDAETRITEDVLRLLRFFRFFAHYGRPPMDRAALTACRKMAPHLADLSGERVAAEILRLLEAPDPASVLIVMQAEGVLAPILPEAENFSRLKMLCWLESRALVRGDIVPDKVRRLAAILPPDPARILAAAHRLRLSNAHRDRLLALAAPDVTVDRGMDGTAIRRLLYRLGPETVRDLILLAWAAERSVSQRLSHRESDVWIALLDQSGRWQPVDFPLTGADLLSLGMSPGPAVGQVLGRVRDWWMDRDFHPDHQQCLDRARDDMSPAMPTA